MEVEHRKPKRIKINLFRNLPTLQDYIKEEDKKEDIELGWRTRPVLPPDEKFAGGAKKDCAIACVGTILEWLVRHFL